MTTKVTVDAHAGWPVEVTTVDRVKIVGEESDRVQEEKTTVPPHTTRDFYVHSTRELHIKELPNQPVTQG